MLQDLREDGSTRYKVSTSSPWHYSVSLGLQFFIMKNKLRNSLEAVRAWCKMLKFSAIF